MRIKLKIRSKLCPSFCTDAFASAELFFKTLILDRPNSGSGVVQKKGREGGGTNLTAAAREDNTVSISRRTIERIVSFW